LNKESFKGAGIQAAANICDRGVKALLTGFCGPNAFKTLEAADIKVANDACGTIQNAIDDYLADRFSFAASANVEGHW
jgi:predicted Fe-Mo cluster-binding NifX family protein